MLLDIVFLLKQHFGNESKVAMWLDTNNIDLDGARPISLIILGQGRKVLTFIQKTIDTDREL